MNYLLLSKEFGLFVSQKMVLRGYVISGLLYGLQVLRDSTASLSGWLKEPEIQEDA